MTVARMAQLPTVKQAIIRYLEWYLAVGRRKPSSHAAHASVLLGSDRPGRPAMGTSLANSRYGSMRIDRLNPQHAANWFAQRCPVGVMADNSVKRSAAAFNGFIDYCVSQGWMDQIMETAKLRRLPRGGRRDEWLRPEQVVAFEDHVLSGEWCDDYRRLLWDTSLTTGVRTAEIPAMQPAHFNRFDLDLLVPHGKGAGTEGKSRTVPVPAVFLDRVLAFVAEHCIGPNDPLFWQRRYVYTVGGRDGVWETVSRGRPLSDAAVRSFLLRVRQEAEVACRQGKFARDLLPSFELTPKVLRKTFACNQFILNARGDGGLSMKELKEALGHEDLRTTDTYLADAHRYLSSTTTRVSTADAARQIVERNERRRRDEVQAELAAREAELERLRSELDKAS